MIKINMQNKVCPYPVIETSKTLKTAKENETIEVLVDNIIATQNLEKMARELGFSNGFSIKEVSNNEFYVTIVKGSGNITIENTSTNNNRNSIIAISSDSMGDGDIELSKKLLEGFIYSLTEHDDILPTHIILYNKGVYLSAHNKKTIEDLKILSEKGVSILSCGLCLDFYNLKDTLAVGEVTNMYTISKLFLTNNVINIG